MGSKNKISSEILPIILSERSVGQYYVEPFCGGLGTMDKVDGPRIASDKNKYLIAMWTGLQSDKSRPYQITKDMYSLARKDYNNGSNEYFSDFLIGWIGWMASFNGRFFDGGYSGKHGNRDYIDEQIRNTESQMGKINGIEFHSCSYSELDIPENSIIYCDIPYFGTKQYATSRDFSHSNFWLWASIMANKGHSVFVSEYSAPDGVKCVWEKEVTNSMNPTKTYKPTERLFKL